jgi:hypothetical protein
MHLPIRVQVLSLLLPSPQAEGRVGEGGVRDHKKLHNFSESMGLPPWERGVAEVGSPKPQPGGQIIEGQSFSRTAPYGQKHCGEMRLPDFRCATTSIGLTP